MRTARALSVSPSMLCRGGVSTPRGVGGLVWGGVYSQGGVWSQGCLLLGGVCSWGVSAPGGVWCRGSALGVVSAPGGCIPACTEADTLPPVNRITHACENITLPQIRCGR